MTDTRNTVADLGIDRSSEDWPTSFFYINSVAVNYWIMLVRFVNKLKKWNRDKKSGRQEDYTRIPNSRPETAIWVEDEYQPGGVYFANFLSNEYLRTEGDLNTISSYSFGKYLLFIKKEQRHLEVIRI